MGKITVDNQEIHFEGQHRLLRFLLDNDIEVPYFCWHPAMTSPTNCRMCLIEVGTQAMDSNKQLLTNPDGSPKINWGFKPVTACNQDLRDGMFIKTHKTSDIIRKAQEGVLEFILANHPLDCPICDQAGECPLQINTYKYAREGSRFEIEKVHKPKRIELGPRVTLDAERCINCTRCVRFTEEISKSYQLTIIARGDKNFPATAPGTIFDDPYSMNVIDICPVGALTSTDFRFKARVWEMNYTPGICVHDSMGTNIDVWVRDNLVMRLTPRYNEAINQYWMADENRLAYHKYNENRVSGIKVLGDIPVDFEQGIQYTADLIQAHSQKLIIVGSAHASVETLHTLKVFAKELGITDLYYVQHHVENRADGFLRTNDMTPNQAGAEMVGYQAITVEALKSKAAAAELVLVIEDGEVASELLKETPVYKVITAATNYFEGHEKAAVVLPAATSIEAPGTYINCKNIPQTTMQAKLIKQMTPEMWMSMPKSRLDAGGVAIDNWRNPQNIVDCLPGWLLISRIGNYLQHVIHYTTHREIFGVIKSTYPLLAELKLPKRNRKETFKISQLDFAITHK
jgi:NADH-quinone oxidoreductase subunit G